MKDIKNYNTAKYAKPDILSIFKKSDVQGPEYEEGEFAAMNIDDIQNLRSIIGKHIYNKDYEENGKTYVKLVIE